MTKENLQNNKVEKFISGVLENKGRLIPIKYGYNILYVTGRRDSEPDRTIHSLTVLVADETIGIKPVGFATFATNQNGCVTAKWTAISLTGMTGKNSTLRCSSLIKDQQAKRIILPLNDNVSFSVSGQDAPGIHGSMTPVAIEEEERGLGLGGFLLQISGHMAKKLGASEIVTPCGISDDITEMYSTKGSLFVRALGSFKKCNHDGSWNLSLENIPTEYLEKFII